MNTHYIKIFTKSGPIAVREQLLDYADSSEHVHLNSWQTALYRALASSEWYCTEGLIEFSKCR